MIDNGESDTTPAGTLPVQSIGLGAAAVAGFAIGGPIGAIVGGMSAPYRVEMAQRSWEEIAAIRGDDVVGLVGQASARLGVDAEESHEAAMSSTEGRSIFADSVQSAAETLDRRKVAGLAKALANGLMNDQAAIDESLIMVRAIADLEAPHVTLLGKLSRGGRRPRLVDSDIAMIAVLERNGLATDDAHERAVAASDELSQEIEKALAELATSTAERLTCTGGTEACRTSCSLRGSAGLLSECSMRPTRPPCTASCRLTRSTCRRCHTRLRIEFTSIQTCATPE